MKKIMVIFILISFSLMNIFAEDSNIKPDLSIYSHPQTQEIVTLVNNATQLIQTEGEDAFPEFRVKGSKWYYNEVYLFIWGLDGMRYVYPSDISGEGKNMLDLKDINGKPIGKMFIETAQAGEGWVFYEWPLPGEEKPQWKSTFIKKAVTPDGKELLVGCGLYNMLVEKVFVENLVKEASNVIKESGLEKAKERFASKADEFIFQDVYIILKDIDGKELFNPFKTNMDSTEYLKLHEDVTIYYIEEIKQNLINKGEAWMSYEWPDKDSKELGKKITFLKTVKLDNELIVVGAGYFN